MEKPHSAQGRTAPGSNAKCRMQVERVSLTPQKDVYNPGDVINLSVYFDAPFIGQVALGLVPLDHPFGSEFRVTIFGKSSNTLYEGQVYVRQADIGTCRLLAKLVPVKGEPRTIPVGDAIFAIRPLVPASPR
jgi:hypothetical protein